MNTHDDELDIFFTHSRCSIFYPILFFITFHILTPLSLLYFRVVSDTRSYDKALNSFSQQAPEAILRVLARFNWNQIHFPRNPNIQKLFSKFSVNLDRLIKLFFCRFKLMFKHVSVNITRLKALQRLPFDWWQVKQTGHFINIDLLLVTSNKQQSLRKLFIFFLAFFPSQEKHYDNDTDNRKKHNQNK